MDGGEGGKRSHEYLSDGTTFCFVFGLSSNMLGWMDSLAQAPSWFPCSALASGVSGLKGQGVHVTSAVRCALGCEHPPRSCEPISMEGGSKGHGSLLACNLHWPPPPPPPPPHIKAAAVLYTSLLTRTELSPCQWHGGVPVSLTVSRVMR